MRASADSKTSKETNGAVHQPEANVQRRAASPCPFLGIAEDAATSFAFATPANHCFCQQPSGRRPPVPVELHHQETYCLTNQYATCPIFQHAENGAVATLPAAEEARPSAAARLAAFLGPFLTTPWRNRLLAVVLVLLVLAASLYFTRDGFPVRELGPEGDDSNAKPALATVAPTGEALVAGDEQNTPTPTSPPSSPSATPASEISRPAAALSTRATSAATPAPPAATRQTSTPEASPTPSPSPVPTTCGAPAGWVNYIVQPGENLFRISLRYNTTMAQLMEANCLTSTSVFAGQALLVPFQAPVPTPSSVPQATTPASPTDPPPPPEPTDPPPAPTATPQPQSSPTPPTIEPPLPSPTATAPPPTPPLPPTATPPLDEEITPTVEATPPPPPEG